MLSHFHYLQLFVTLWTVATRLLCPWDSPGKNTRVGCPVPLGDLPHPGMEPESLMSPAPAGRFLTSSATWEALPTVSFQSLSRIRLFATPWTAAR